MFDMRHSMVVRWLAIRIALLPVLFVLASGTSYLVVYGIGPGPSYACITAGCPERDESRGVDGSLLTDYADWLWHAVRGDLGDAFPLRGSVRERILERLPANAELTGLSLVLALALAVPLGVTMARDAGSVSHGVASGLLALSSPPVFFTSVLALILPAQWWHYAPPIGIRVSLLDHPWDHIRQFAPPAAIIALSIAAPATFAVRSRLLRTGLSRRSVVEAAMYAAAVVLPAIVAASVIVEMVWTIPGLGYLQLVGVTRALLPTAQGATTVLVFGVLALRLFLTVEGDQSYRPVGHVPPWQAMLKSSLWVTGAIIVVAFVVFGLAGPWVAPHDPRAVSTDWSGAGTNDGPSWEHLLGTDRLGRDVLSRVLDGARQPLVFAGVAAVLGYVPGLAFGVALTFVRTGRRIGEAIGWLGGAPALLIAVPVVYDTNGDRWAAIALVAAFAFLMGTGVARSAPALRGMSRSGAMRGIAVHAIPGVLDAMAFAVLLHAMLGFLGLQIDPEWGRGWGHDVDNARLSIPVHYWALLAPGMAIAIVLFGLRLCAESFRDLARQSGQLSEGESPASP